MSAFECLNSKNVMYCDIKLEKLILEKNRHNKITDFDLYKDGNSDGASLKTFFDTQSTFA